MRLLSVLLVSLLSACATQRSVQVQEVTMPAEQIGEVAKVKTESDALRAYHDNAKYVKRLTNWKITGAIAAKHGSEGWQARVIWREESPQEFSGRLYAYFSPEQVVIKGKPGKVILFDEKGQQFEDRSIENMIKKSTGWRIPMDQLRYWVRGIAAPNSTSKVRFNKEGRITSMKQSGWALRYKDYVSISGYVLPKKVELVSGDLRVRLVISKWTF